MFLLCTHFINELLMKERSFFTKSREKKSSNHFRKKRKYHTVLYRYISASPAFNFSTVNSSISWMQKDLRRLCSLILIYAYKIYFNFFKSFVRSSEEKLRHKDCFKHIANRRVHMS